MKYFLLESSSVYVNIVIHIKYVFVNLLLVGQLYPVEEK